MSYIGLPPKANFTSGLLDRFTSTTGTTVTLTHDISSENDIVVFVNFVKQDSTTYSVGGSGNKTLTLGGTLVSSDIVEVHYLNIVGQTVNPSANSVGSSQLTADSITGQTAETSIANDDTIIIHDTSASALKKMTKANFVSGIGGVNSPRILVCMNNYHTITANTATKVPFNRVDINTGGTWDGTNYRWTPGTAGTYVISWQVFGDAGSANNLRIIEGTIKISGTSAMTAFIDFRDYHGRSSTISNSIITELTDSNYIELFATIYDTSGNPDLGGGSSNAERFKTYISSYKIIT